MSLQLTIISLDFESDTTPVTTKFDKDVISFGRDSSNDVVLEQEDIAEFHLELRLEHDDQLSQTRIFATDLGSVSGTLVENMPLHPHLEKEMSPNERIIIGSYLIKAKLIPDARVTRQAIPTSQVTQSDNRISSERSTGKVLQRREEAKLEAETNSAVTSAKSKTSTKPAVPQSIIKASRVKAPTLEESEVKEYFQAVEERPAARFHNEPRREEYQETEPSQVLISGQLEADELNHVDFEAIKLLTLHGIITHHGAPLAGVHIDAGRIGQTVTGPDGTFSFCEIEEYTPFSITASKAGFDFTCDVAQGTLTNDIVLEFFARELFTISGVVMHHGQPLQQVEIDAGDLGVTVTDRNGRYAFNDIPEGITFNIKASKKSYRFECRNNLGKVRSSLNIDFKAVKLVQLSGIISHQGSPLEGVEIDAGPLGKTVTGADGRYCFNDIPEGTRYTLAANKTGFRFQRKTGNI